MKQPFSRIFNNRRRSGSLLSWSSFREACLRDALGLAVIASRVQPNSPNFIQFLVHLFCRFAFFQKTGQSPAFEETATSLPSLPLPIYPMASVSHVGGGHPTTPVCIFNTRMVGRSPAWRKKSRELAAAEPFFATHGKAHVLSCQLYVVRVVFGGGETIHKWLRVILFQLSSIVLHL